MLNGDSDQDNLVITSNKPLGILMQAKLPGLQVTERELCVSFITRKRRRN